jgi:hypothetical protein
MAPPIRPDRINRFMIIITFFHAARVSGYINAAFQSSCVPQAESLVIYYIFLISFIDFYQKYRDNTVTHLFTEKSDDCKCQKNECDQEESIGDLREIGRINQEYTTDNCQQEPDKDLGEGPIQVDHV